MGDSRYDTTEVCAFKYMWYIDANDNHWSVGTLGNPYTPTGGVYPSNSAYRFKRDTYEAWRSGVTSFALSDWYGPWAGYDTDKDDDYKSESCILDYFKWLESPDNPIPDFKACILFELDDAAPTAAQVLELLNYHRPKFASPNYLRKRAIKKTDGTTILLNQPVFIIYSEPFARISNYVDGVKLYEAAHPGETVHLCLEVNTGWTDHADVAIVDTWYKYAPWGDEEYYHYTGWIHPGSVGTPTAYSAYSSFTVTPGGETADEDDPDYVFLARSAVNYLLAILFCKALAEATKPSQYVIPNFYFICSWDEWGESSIIAPATAWSDSASGYPDGEYMDLTLAGFGSRLAVNKFNVLDGG